MPRSKVSNALKIYFLLWVPSAKFDCCKGTRCYFVNHLVSAVHVTVLAVKMGLVSLESVTEVRKVGNARETSWRRG